MSKSRTLPSRLLLAAALVAMGAFVTGCGGSEAAGSGNLETRSQGPEAAGQSRLAAEVVATEEDWRILRETALRAERRGLDTVPVGDAVAGVGLLFVGTPYRPQTLEVPGSERLVVNLRALDCVTLVETALAVVHTLREPGSVSDWSEEKLRTTYADALRTIRYRGADVRGYSSRLHYFSEWIRDAEEKGLMEHRTPGLGGIPDSSAIDFMSTHPDSYRQLSDSSVLDEIRRTEERISLDPRIYIPEGRIADVAPGIRSGDIIAATSTVEGLDIAHTGIALWRGERLHLLHAPLVGDSVQVSPRTLAERIVEIEGQDGIMVARPVFQD